jgi:hypothetical protein
MIGKLAERFCGLFSAVCGENGREGLAGATRKVATGRFSVDMGVWTKSLARRTLPHGLSAGIVGCVSLGSQEVYRDPSSAAHAG